MKQITEKVTPVAAALSALATLVCCLPLGIPAAVAALGLSVALDWLRPWLIAIAVILLGVSFLQIYRGRRSCRRNSRLSLLLFGVSAVVVVGVILFPQILADLLSAL